MDEDNQSLIKQLFHFNSLVQHYYGTHFKNWGHFDNPQRGQAHVLTILRSQPEMTQKELRNLLNVRNQSLGELLTKLERQGYITRCQSDCDRRIMNIKLTEIGREVADKLQNKIDSINAIFDCLNNGEKEIFYKLMQTLISEMEQYADTLASENQDGPVKEETGY